MRKTLEREYEAPSRSGPSPGARQRAKHPEHKLALCRPQAQTNEMLILEEHPSLLAEHKNWSSKVRTHITCEGSQTAHFQQPSHPQHDQSPTGSMWSQ